MPTPALLTSMSSRPKRSLWVVTTWWMTASSAMLPATEAMSRPSLDKSATACLSFSGRRAATVTP